MDIWKHLSGQYPKVVRYGNTEVGKSRRPPATQDEINQQRIERNRRAQELRQERIAAQAAREAQEVPATQDEINQRRIVRGRRVPAIR